MSFISRRSLVRAAAAALAAPYVVPSTVFGAAAPSNRITFGCIGVGGQGGGHLGNLLGNTEAQVLAVCEVDAGRRDKARQRAEQAYAARSPSGSYQGCVGYNDFRELLARRDIDAVTIVTPDHWHAIMCIAAMKAGKDVYCEKPLTLTIAEGRAIADVQKRYGRVFQTGAQRRSSPRCRRAIELVRNGFIGKLLRVEAGVGLRPTQPCLDKPEPIPPGFDYDMWLGPAPWAPYTTKRCHYNFRFVRDYSGGEMTNFGAHFLDLAQWGIGADDSGPVEIVGKGEYFADGIWDTFAKVDITYTYANGVKLTCTSDRQGCRFFGTEGWVDGDSGATEPKSIATAVIPPGGVRLYESNSHMGNFLACVKSRRPTVSPAEVGHRTCTVCHLGNIAMTLERPLKWDPVKERFVNDPEADRMLYRPMRGPWHL